MPDVDEVEARIAYLVEIGIPEDQIGEKVLSKVSEVLGCDVTLIAANVEHIEKKWGSLSLSSSLTFPVSSARGELRFEAPHPPSPLCL